MRAQALSILYRATRKKVIERVYARQDREQRPRDLEEAVELGDAYLKKLDIPGSSLWYDFSLPRSMGAYLYELYFPSPIIISSFKDDPEVLDIWLRLGAGGAILKTMMREERKGNARPRLQEVEHDGMSGFLNAMGLPGKSREDKLRDIANSSLFSHGRPIGISIGGSSLEEYADNFSAWRHHSLSHHRNQFVEVNISCPNTPEGQQMTKHPELLEDLLFYMRHRSSVIIGVKLSPDQSNQDILKYVEIIKSVARTYVNLGNTTYRTCESVGLPKNAISIGGGGLSGPGLYKRTLEMVDLCSTQDIPIIATGGIDSTKKVKELLSHGATLAAMATAVVKDMYCIPKINNELSKT